MSNKRCTLFVGSKRRSQASINGRLFEGSIGRLYGVLCSRRGLLGGSPTLANLENDHGFISKEYISIGMKPFGEASKAMRAYAQSEQYHTIVGDLRFLTIRTRLKC